MHRFGVDVPMGEHLWCDRQWQLQWLCHNHTVRRIPGVTYKERLPQNSEIVRWECHQAELKG